MAGQITYDPNTNSALHDITVAIPTFDDDPVVLGYALDAALAQGLVHPITIVDMSRGSEVAAAARARGKGVRVIRCPDSRGVSDSRNRLVALVETRYLLFLDADAVPTPGWAEAMRRRFDDDERAAVVGARCLPHWPTLLRPCSKQHRQATSSRSSIWVQTPSRCRGSWGRAMHSTSSDSLRSRSRSKSVAPPNLRSRGRKSSFASPRNAQAGVWSTSRVLSYTTTSARTGPAGAGCCDVYSLRDRSRVVSVSDLNRCRGDPLGCAT